MEPERHVLHQAALSFFRTLGVIAGLLFIPFVLGMIGIFTMDLDQGVESKHRVHVLPGADGTRSALKLQSPVILQVNIDGVIGAGKLTMDHVRDMLQDSREGDFADDRVKAVLLHIRSPGGTVMDSDSIYRALKAYKEAHNLPVYAYIDGIGASGGMYVAAAADKIYASEVSMVGSIGVLGPSLVNVSQLMEKIGVTSMTISEGKGKDALNPLRPWTPGEEANLTSLISTYYKIFVDILTAARPKIDRDALVNDYGASVYAATEAEALGYIDGVHNSISDVIAALAEEAKISDDNYQVVELTPKTVFADLFEASAPLRQGKLIHEIQLGSQINSELSGQFLYLWSPGLETP